MTRPLGSMSPRSSAVATVAVDSATAAASTSPIATTPSSRPRRPRPAVPSSETSFPEDAIILKRVLVRRYCDAKCPQYAPCIPRRFLDSHTAAPPRLRILHGLKFVERHGQPFQSAIVSDKVEMQ